MVSSETGGAYGGGIGQIGTGVTVYVTRSTISGNTADVETNGNAIGGGISAWSLTSLYSNFVGNTAGVDGGGVFARWNSLVKYSTFENNSSLFSGGAIDHWATTDLMIVNSTFSRNRSHGGGAIDSGGTLEIYNSTIAFNSSDSSIAGGIYFNGSSLKLERTIVAGNQNTTSIGSDIFVGGGTLSGAANAVMSSNTSPPGVITVTSDPMLAPLSWTGGLTRTHGLLLNSPLIGVGNNAINRTYDQRGFGFPRATGPMTTVDIGAVQFDDRIFVSNLDQFFF
jgi:hypothetical protein